MKMKGMGRLGILPMIAIVASPLAPPPGCVRPWRLAEGDAGLLKKPFSCASEENG